MHMYYFFYGIFYLLSLLPFWLLHLVSDAICQVVFHVAGYRKKIVMQNLLTAFPDKTEKERKKIARDFYGNLIDTFIESSKMVSMTRKELHKRFQANYEVINDLHAKGITVQLHAGHFFNWEFANYAFADKIQYPFVGVYMPIRNRMFNKLFFRLRSRFGTRLIAANNFKNEFAPYRAAPYCLALVGDQNPGKPETAYWTEFLGKRAPFTKGPEQGARKNKTAVVFCEFFPVRRGYYKGELSLITMDASEMEEGDLTRRYIDFIEAAIHKRPANYLWSHRRWKHKYKDAYEPLLLNRATARKSIVSSL